MSYVKSRFLGGSAYYHGSIDLGLKEIRPDFKAMKSDSGPVKQTSGTTMICLLQSFTYTVTTSWAGKDGPMRNFLKANLQWSLLSATFKYVISNPHKTCYCLILQLRNWISKSWILHLNPSRPGSKVSQEAPGHPQVAAVVCSVYGDLGDVISARWKGDTQGTKKSWFQRLLQFTT